MKRFLRRFAFVRELEQKSESDKYTIESMARHIDALDAIRIHQQERIELLQTERDELYRHLNGRLP